MVAVTLSLTDEQYAALLSDSARFGVTPDVRLLSLLRASLDDVTRRYLEARWQSRRKAIEGDATLAALVDAAGAVEVQR
jgi:hypothetical protein